MGNELNNEIPIPPPDPKAKDRKRFGLKAISHSFERPDDGQAQVYDEDLGRIVWGTPTSTANHGPNQHTEGNAWKDTYQDASGDETEIALGASGTYKRSTGAASAPAYSAILDADVPATHSGSAHHAAVTASGAHTMSGQDITAVAASTTLAAHIELATVGEILAGTDLTRALSPGGVAGVVQNARWTFAADAEASDAYVITLTPTLPNYFVGMLVWFTANTANTGAATLDINSVGPQTIKKHHDQDLADGDIEAGAVVGVVWDGTNWQMVSQLGNAPAAGHTEDHDHDGSPTQQLLAANTHQTISGVSASTTAQGHVELATTAETDTGTDTGRAVTPDGLAGSYAGTKSVSILVSDPNGDAITTGNGKASFLVPSALNGMNLVAVAAGLTTVSSSGAITVQVRRNRRASATTRTDADMLSTALTIDASEFSSVDAATAAVINGSNDDVVTGDQIHIDIDGAGTGAKGLQVVLEFRLP